MTQFYKQVIPAIILLLIINKAQADINLSLTPLSQIGNTVELGINISGLGGGVAPAISTFDLNLQFNPAYLTYASTAFGDPLLGDQLDVYGLGVNLKSATLTVPGVVEIFELSFDTPSDLNAFQAASYTLAVVDFTINQAVSSEVTLGLNAIGDAEGNPISANLFSATVTTVPLPTAFCLFLGGLGLVFNRNLRRDT